MWEEIGCVHIKRRGEYDAGEPSKHAALLCGNLDACLSAAVERQGTGPYLNFASDGTHDIVATNHATMVSGAASHLLREAQRTRPRREYHELQAFRALRRVVLEVS